MAISKVVVIVNIQVGLIFLLKDEGLPSRELRPLLLRLCLLIVAIWFGSVLFFRQG